MLIFHRHKDEQRLAVDPTLVISVREHEGYSVIAYRISPAQQSMDGVCFVEVAESFNDVVRAIIDSHDTDWLRWQRQNVL